MSLDEELERENELSDSSQDELDSSDSNGYSFDCSTGAYSGGKSL
jgi:hypothetical protein